MEKNEFYYAAIKPTRIALTVYAVIKQLFFTLLVPGNGWISRLIINIVWLSFIYAVTGSKKLTRKQITYAVLLSSVFAEIIFYISVDGDRIIVPYLIGVTLLSIVYSDIKASIVTLVVTCLTFGFCLFVLDINVVGMEYEMFDLIFDLSSIVIIGFMTVLIGKYTIGTLDKARADAEFATKAKSDFLASMSHEIRTPMNAITGMAELAMHEDMSPAAREYVRTIKQAGGSLLAIINDILDISKIESGKLEIVPTEYRLLSLVYDTGSIIKARITNPKILFTMDIDCDLPSVLYGDEIRVRQIMLNLLTNAVKYTKKGSITLTINGSIVNDDTLLLTAEIADTGIGIKQGDIDKIFGNFVRVDATVNRNIEGTGLGLSITKKLVKAMGGDISVKSEYGKGSAFTVTLPQKIISSEPLASDDFDSDEKKIIAKFSASGSKVLVVDDIKTNLEVAKGLLAHYEMQVDTCDSGADAIDAIKKIRYDAVFMDHMMPEMDGVEATRRIRALGSGDAYFKNLPIIALTANAVSGTKEMFLQNGFNDFLPKPIDTAILGSIIEKWIPEGKRAVRSGDSDTDNGNINDIDINDIGIDNIDVNCGLARTGGKPAGYLKTLAVFRDDGREKINEIKTALERNELQLYTTYVHALKSASANIGAIKLSEAAKELEMAGKREDRKYIDENTHSVLTELETLIADIDKVVTAQKAKQTAQTDIDANVLKSILTDLKDALNAINPAAINAAVKQLEPFENAAGLGEKINAITQHILNGEFDEAEEITKELLEG